MFTSTLLFSLNIKTCSFQINFPLSLYTCKENICIIFVFPNSMVGKCFSFGLLQKYWRYVQTPKKTIAVTAPRGGENIGTSFWMNINMPKWILMFACLPPTASVAPCLGVVVTPWIDFLALRGYKDTFTQKYCVLKDSIITGFAIFCTLSVLLLILAI